MLADIMAPEGRSGGFEQQDQKRVQNPNVKKLWICKKYENYHIIVVSHAFHCPPEEWSLFLHGVLYQRLLQMSL
jgi:hypothetical protein